MDRASEESRAAGEAKEPIRKPWIWVVLAGLVLVGIPWYLPQGTVQPLVLGLPYWMIIAVISSLALCGFLSWLCLNEWDLVEAEEERAADGAASEAASGAGDGFAGREG